MKEIFKEKGIVESINDKSVEIALHNLSNCEDCTAKIFCKPTTDDKNILSVNSDEKFQIGDSVEVFVKGKTVLLFTCFLYGVPLVLLIITLFIGLIIFEASNYSEFYSFALGVGSLIIYYLLFNNIIKHNNKLFSQPTVIKTDNSN
jgi:sigma-E factor negative regulatory protein RseC